MYIEQYKELYNSLLNNDYSNIKVNEKYKRDKDGNTLLHYAVKDANFEMVQDLIKLRMLSNYT